MRLHMPPLAGRSARARPHKEGTSLPFSTPHLAGRSTRARPHRGGHRQAQCYEVTVSAFFVFLFFVLADLS